MIDSVQVRSRGAVDFQSYYEYACALQDSVPLPAVKAKLGQGILDLNGDRLKLVDWTPILNSLAINKHLHHVAIRSYHQPSLGEAERYRTSYRKKIPAFRSKDMTFRLCKSVRDCLTVSHSLKTLELQGLPLRERDLIILTKGLAKTTPLENLSLAYCPIGDEGLEVICQSVKNSASIKTVNFAGCNLTWSGAEHMANIVKYQATKRHSEAWAESLRYRKPDLDCMTGLRRINLSCNTLIGDRGAVSFADALREDLWLKALDLQKCGISNEGARALLDVLQSNTTIVVLDLRKNPLVDNDLIKSLIERVLVNSNEASPEYNWINLPPAKDSLKPKQRKRTIMLGSGVRGKATIRIGPRKLSSNGKSLSVIGYDVPQPLPPGAHGYIPWRTAARASRHRGCSSLQESFFVDQTIKAESPVKVILESDFSETEELDDNLQGPTVSSFPDKIDVKQYKRLQVELEECRLRLREEKRARAKADARLVELDVENAQIRNINLSLSEALHAQCMTSSILEDEAVLESIETSFKKFHAFLDLLKDAGLGQLASMAGISQSDFGPLGRPQFSSTVGKPEARLTEDTDHRAEERPSASQFAAGNTDHTQSVFKSAELGNGAIPTRKEWQKSGSQSLQSSQSEPEMKYPSQSSGESSASGRKF